MTEHIRDQLFSLQRVLAEEAFDEGIRTATEMLRGIANQGGYRRLLRLRPKFALEQLATAIERTATSKPDIVPKPQPPPGRVVDAFGRTVGYIPRSQGDTPNPPPTDP